MNIIKTLVKKSLDIYKQEGIVGLLRKRKEYYEAYPPVRKSFYYWVNSKFRNEAVKQIHGYRMILNFNDFGLSKQLWINGFREPECSKHYCDMVDGDDVVLDVGANIGYYVLMVAKQVKKVYALEPLPENQNFLLRNIDLNDLDNVVVYPFAVSNHNCHIPFFVGRRKNQANMFEGEDSVEVFGVTVDHFCVVYNVVPTVIRMDIEGFEYYAIGGMKNTLKNNDCKLFFEVHPFQMQQRGLDWMKPIDKLGRWGYKPFIVVKEFGGIKEQSFFVDDGFDFLGVGICPSFYTHGFGLFLRKEGS